MTQMNIVEPRLEWFVGVMRQKLSMPKNVAKSDWRRLSISDNIQGINGEVLELILAYGTRPIPTKNEIDAMILECADIANRAMMLADQLHDMMERRVGR